ncbi:MAG: TetR/AcrR family transcriptional regulator, partial [Dysgonamonadaceae bacterium]|nr:TetR/AcrR family transcriptional regulator [Dysgonamonadaceae bacterium]
MEEFKNNKKFQDIAATAKTLFWKYGIKRVTVEEICKEAYVSKMTFYKFFKKKDALAEYLLINVLAEWHDQYRAIMKQDIAFASKINQVIALEQKASENMGEEFFNDILNNEYPDLQKLINESTESYHSEIVEDMIEAQQQGEIRKNIKPEFLLYLLKDISEKVMDENLSK